MKLICCCLCKNTQLILRGTFLATLFASLFLICVYLSRVLLIWCALKCSTLENRTCTLRFTFAILSTKKVMFGDVTLYELTGGKHARNLLAQCNDAKNRSRFSYSLIERFVTFFYMKKINALYLILPLLSWASLSFLLLYKFLKIFCYSWELKHPRFTECCNRREPVSLGYL